MNRYIITISCYVQAEDDEQAKEKAQQFIPPRLSEDAAYNFWMDCQKNYGKFHPTTARAKEDYFKIKKQNPNSLKAV